MMFISGFLCALLLIIAIALIETRLDGQGIKRASQNVSKAILKRRAALFIPDSDEERLQSELVDRNEQAGRATPLEDL